MSGSGDMPFWAYSNQYDLMPRTSGYTAMFDAGMPYQGGGALQWHWKASAVLRSDEYDRSTFFPDELYAGLKWKNLALDLGLKHIERDFLANTHTLGTISVTGGNIVMSGNARSMPGYRITLSPLDVPFTAGHLQIKGAFADYLMTDNRVEGRTLTHNTQLYLIGCFGKVRLTAGLDHWTMWDGSGLENYFRILFGMKAGRDGVIGDRINALGNHLGSERLAASYEAEKWRAEFRHDIPYEDKSGMIFKNFPDGVNTFCFSFRDRNRWVSDIVYEYQYTMFQSGSEHDPEVDEDGVPIPWRPGLNYIGGDDYFNNGAMKTGWTHYRMTLGNPLFFPDGTRSGVWDRKHSFESVENNRLRSHHIGITGQLFRTAPYKLMLTWSRCYGRYFVPYAGESQYQHPWGTVKETPLNQFSSGFVCEIPMFKRSMHLVTGIYYDLGQVLHSSFGATIGLRYSFTKQ